MGRFGVAPERMSAIGYGEFKPIADNDTEAGRQKNRRVVLVILGNQDTRRTLDMNNDNDSEQLQNELLTPLLNNTDSSSETADTPATSP
jgi:chemotaxis protein MotB